LTTNKKYNIFFISKFKPFFCPKEDTLNLSAPKFLTFIIAVVVAVIGLLGYLDVIAAVAPFAFWLVFAAFVLLALGNLLSGF